MFNVASLTTTLLLALAVAANPIVTIDEPLVTLPLVRRFNATGMRNVLANDQARARALVSMGRASAARKAGLQAPPAERAVISIPASNQVVTYFATVNVGSPASSFSLLIDTGSSNTWVGATKKYTATSTSTNTGHSVSVTYGSGSFSGTEFTDRVDLGNGLVIPSQSIGVASRSTGFQGTDGILGIGPVDLTQGTVSGVSSVPTVTDNLFKQGTITNNLVAVSFNPTNSEAITNGELTFGGTDSSKFTGSIGFAPITSTSPASEFWGINQSIRFGASTSIQSSSAGIVDTGTTLVLIASDAFTRYTKATGGVNDATTGLLRLTTAQFSSLQSLFFVNSAGTFELTANAQAFPRNLNADIGGNANSVYLIVNSIGTPTGEGLDFINGYAFLERFYSVFDTANRRVGFATTPNTRATTN